MKLRAEIDGLRAVAVLPVILFHAGFSGFAGGFVGVDVFFVISGFLITGILLDDLAADRFSLLRFYERRARRILPALFLVTVVSFPFAYAWMTPADLSAFAKSAMAVTVFGSNILFFWESGYFDTAAELKPLLHTWSLAVEEQFYIFFPPLLFVAWKLGVRWCALVVGLVLLASLSVSVWTTRQAPEAAYYLIWSRAWELMIGSLAAFAVRSDVIPRSRPLAEIAGVLGLALIFFAIFSFSEATPFPGIAAAVPTLGTVLIILFASPKTIVGGVLSWRPFVGIGLISYSAYLWHFPIFAFARYRLLDPPPDWSMAVLSVLTLALAYLSWRFVEQPFRRPGAFDRRRIFVFSGMSAVTLAALGAFFVWSEGFPARMPNLVGGYNVAETLGLRITPHDPLTPHRSGEKEVGGFQTFSADGSTGGKRVLIIGDSHANHLVGFAAHIVAEQGAAVTINWYPGCPPIFGTYKVYNVETGMTARAERCQQQVEDWETYIQEKHDDFDYVILSSRWNWLLNDSAYAGIKIRRDALLVRGTRPGDIAEMTAASPHILQQGLSRTVAKLNGLGLPVILFTQPPLLTRHAGTCNFHLHPTCGLPPYDAVMERQAAMDAVVEGSGVFGPEAQNVEVRLVDYLCDHAKQRCQTFEGEKLYYRDRNHLSTTGSVMVGQAFLQNHPDWFAPPFGQ